MLFFSNRRLLGAMFVALCLVLSGCANLDRKITGVTLKPGAKPEPVTSLALVFISPELNGKDPGLVRGYAMAGILNPATMKRTSDRAAEFLTLNGLQTQYLGSFDKNYPLNNLLKDWAAKGYSTLVFVPMGSSITTQNGSPVWASARYRVTLYDRQLKPSLELFDDYNGSVFTSNQADTVAAGWMNALIANGYAVKKSDKLVQPPYRDFVKEDREAKVPGK
ncbi:hypothetical protein [Polaromonas sp.]|uniref:hypothetical protein n=1 Tax=Polaromonas sp. TaxID=1869339 RepID=UPI003CB34F84